MKTRVLFLGKYNSCRSQMAEGLANHYLGDRLSACSAGIEATSVSPDALAVMDEIGIDISTQSFSDADEFSDQEFDYVVTLVDDAQEICFYQLWVSYCGRCAEVCPHLELTSHGGKRLYLEGFPDPSQTIGDGEELMEAFRKTRDAIKSRIFELFS